MDKIEKEFLQHSNWIENEYGMIAIEDAIMAWEYQKVNGITLESILETHRLLLQRLRPDIAGKWRDCDVYIGGRCCKFISESLIKEDIDFLCERINYNISIQTLFDEPDEPKTKELHIRFEQIHPFTDGNGRVGRIIYNKHRLDLGLPIHVIHEGMEQMEYYKWFR